MSETILDTTEFSQRQPSPAPQWPEPNRAGEDCGLGQDVFIPEAPRSLAEAGITADQTEALILKVLFSSGPTSGRKIAGQIALPFGIIEQELLRLKSELLVSIKTDAPLSDFLYELSSLGSEQARVLTRQSTYCGAVPVTIEAYCKSVSAQSVRHQQPKIEDIRRAMADTVLSDEMMTRIGEAANAGLAFFLFGSPGNGKTRIAERINRAYGEPIWIPRAIGTCGEVIRLFDPAHHEEMPFADNLGTHSRQSIDSRWVRIRRPTVIAGGELTLEQLEVRRNPATGVIEAPLHMKSNCGTLVIDDFGRQRVNPRELLDRWIVPLEKRRDYLGLPSGRQFQVPFEQLVIFATNLRPRDLVDEAFLRRIPYKIEVDDPSDEQFRKVFRAEARRMGIDYSRDMVEYLLQHHYRDTDRPLRFCHAKDLLRQIGTACRFRGLPMVVTEAGLDRAVRNYFSCTD